MNKPRTNLNASRSLLIIGCCVALIVLVTVLVMRKSNTASPRTSSISETGSSIERSKESLCDYLKTHDEPSGDADLVKYFEGAELRAPDDIVKQISKVRKGYEEIDNNPSRRLEISLDINDASTDYVNWYPKNCN